MYDINSPGLVISCIDNLPGDAVKSNMINATAMAKPFGKKVYRWLRLSSTKRFLTELGEIKKVSVSNLVVKKYGNGKDTWIHEDAALEFARWLSPSFAIWNNQRTKELLLTGKKDTNREEQLPIVSSDLLLTKVVELEEVMNELARKADYHDAVLQSRTLITTSVIAKELGMSAIALNKLLHDKKIIYRIDDHWVLYASYQGNGYTGTKTALYLDSQGKYQSNIHTYWTEKGREFIHNIVKEMKQIA